MKIIFLTVSEHSLSVFVEVLRIANCRGRARISSQGRSHPVGTTWRDR